MKHTINQSTLWVYTTAFIMSFNGGYINSICLVSTLKNAVGYVTGNLTLAGDSFEKSNYILFFHVLFLVLCFLGGSIVSGLIVKGQNLEKDNRYNISLLLQIIFIFISIIMLFFGYKSSSYLLAITMGMQNAMTTHYGTALIRTTHMTGTTTDLGILIARYIKGYSIEYWKLILYITLIMGAIIYSWINVFALFISIIIYAVMIKLKN